MSEKRIEIPCAFGTLVASVVGDPGVYDEIGIDLVRDGETMQLCTVWTGPKPDGDGVDLHVYVWSGKDECADITVHPDMDTATWW